MNIYLIIIFILIILSIIYYIYYINKSNYLLKKLINTHKFLSDINLDSFNPNKINMPIYYINLDRSKDRDEFIKTQLSLYNINATRINAIDGSKLNLNEGTINLYDSIEINYINKYKNNSLSELGCTLSHIKAIYNAYINNDDIALIIEDDASFVLYPYWPLDLNSIIKKAPYDWTIISIFGYDCTLNNIKGDFLPFTLEKPCYSTVSYIINKKGMLNVLYDIINHNIINLDPNSKNFNCPDTIAADLLIYYRAKNSYNYIEYPLIIPYNNSDIMDSTIHTSHTLYQVKNSLEALEKYLIRDNNLIMVKKCWSSNLEIPKIIHQIWFNYKSDTPTKDMIYMSKNCKNLHKDFKYMFWDDKACRDLLVNDFPWFLETYDNYDKVIKKINSIRYFILFKYGGIYLDMDTICLKNINTLLENGKAIFGYQFKNINRNDSVCNSFMATTPNHPLFENLIMCLKNYKNKDVMKSTGPTYLTNQIKKYNGKDLKIYEMPILYTHEWNDNSKSDLNNCITDTDYCKNKYPHSYLTTTFSKTW